MAEQTLLKDAQNGDIRAFHTLFAEFQPQLKSYLYRLLANRNDMEDMVQDSFIAAFENLGTFRGEASLKTWVFTIATNRARRQLKKEKRWAEDSHERARALAHAQPELFQSLLQTSRGAPAGTFTIREHIDYCFTCVSKMLPIRQQIALILKDVYRFKNREIAAIMDTSESKVKHAVRDARQKMIAIFDHTCALVNKNGICDQCSQLNGVFNPKQDQQAALMKVEWARNQADQTDQELYALRRKLVRAIDPIQGEGTDLHELFFDLNRRANRRP